MREGNAAKDEPRLRRRLAVINNQRCSYRCQKQTQSSWEEDAEEFRSEASLLNVENNNEGNGKEIKIDSPGSKKSAIPKTKEQLFHHQNKQDKIILSYNCQK